MLDEIKKENEKIIHQEVLKYLNRFGSFRTKEDLKNEFYKKLFGEKDFYSTKDSDISALEFGGVFDEMKEKGWIRIVDGISEKNQESMVVSCTEKKRFLEFCLTQEVFTLEDATKYVYQSQIENSNEQKNSLVELNEKMRKQSGKIFFRLTGQDKKIKEFYTNILGILGILIAVFSIIGFNIQGIGSILDHSNNVEIWNYVGGIAVINICVVISIYLLFYLINKIINKKEEKKGLFSEKAFWILLTIFIIIIAMCFVVA